MPDTDVAFDDIRQAAARIGKIAKRTPVLHSSGFDSDAKLTAFYDLYRIENGRQVEHWDVLETIPPSNQWKNPNGKF